MKSMKSKINLENQITFNTHRSGWEYALQALKPLHNPEGVLFDGFLEKNFAWSLNNAIKTKTVPYQSPWVGFIHNPPKMAPWLNQNQNSPERFIRTVQFQESLKHCKGLFVLSNYLKDWLKQHTDVPIKTLCHPTETPELKWSPEAFFSQPKVVQLGFWLRKLTSIYHIKTNYKKIFLLTRKDIYKDFFRKELNFTKQRLDERSVKLQPHVSNEQYDIYLSSSIGFMDLYDTSCNNAVIECIVRNTPLLINRHPATEEYLGKKYPLFFDDLNHASSLLTEAKILEAHQYLLNLDKSRFTQEYFLKTFKNSKIYKSL